MAGTRNKQTRGEFSAYHNDLEKHAEWIQSTRTILEPAYPCSGINVQRLPNSALSTNAVDIESFLHGIGSNNYIYPEQPVKASFTQLKTVSFIPPTNVYIPVLPPLLQHQRANF